MSFQRRSEPGLDSSFMVAPGGNWIQNGSRSYGLHCLCFSDKLSCLLHSCWSNQRTAYCRHVRLNVASAVRVIIYAICSAPIALKEINLTELMRIKAKIRGSASVRRFVSTLIENGDAAPPSGHVVNLSLYY